MGTTTSSGVVARVLFGQTRRDVLALLLGRPDERFYLREILRAIGGGTGAVQRELKQLVDAGLVGREREGHQVYFSANRESAIFPELQGVVQKTAGLTDLPMVIGDVTLADLVPLIRVAARKLGREVNPSVYPVKEFTAGLKRGAHFLKRAVAGPKLFVEGSERAFRPTDGIAAGSFPGNGMMTKKVTSLSQLARWSGRSSFSAGSESCLIVILRRSTR